MAYGLFYLSSFASFEKLSDRGVHLFWKRDSLWQVYENMKLLNSVSTHCVDWVLFYSTMQNGKFLKYLLSEQRLDPK